MAAAMLRSQAKSLARTIRALAEMAALPVVVVVVVATLVEGSLLPSDSVSTYSSTSSEYLVNIV